MTYIATLQTESVYKRLAGNATASAIVPPDVFAAFDAEKSCLAVQQYGNTEPIPIQVCGNLPSLLLEEGGLTLLRSRVSGMEIVLEQLLKSQKCLSEVSLKDVWE